MGYRLYLAKMPKVEYEKIKDMTYPELATVCGNPGEDYFGVYELPFLETIHELGKGVDFSNSSGVTPLFPNAVDDEHDRLLCDETVMLDIIKNYHGQITEYYSAMSDHMKWLWMTPEQREETTMASTICHTAPDPISHIRSMLHEWGNNYFMPYSLDKSVDGVVDSWKYEYVIFEIVRLYKTFDWDNDVLIYYGY